MYTLGRAAMGGKIVGRPLPTLPPPPSSPPSLLTMVEVVMTESGRLSPFRDRSTVNCSYVGKSRSEAVRGSPLPPLVTPGGGRWDSVGRRAGRSVGGGVEPRRTADVAPSTASWGIDGMRKQVGGAGGESRSPSLA